MKNFFFILAAVFALSTTQASADEDFYAGVFGGANWLDISTSHHHDRNDSKSRFDTGYVVGGTIGYRWCGGLRIEGEIAYRNNERKKHHRCNRDESSSSCGGVIGEDFSSSSNDLAGNNRHKRGHAQIVSYLANVLYDYQFECTPWKAFAGFGLGYAQHKGFNHRRNNFNNDNSGSNYNDNNSYYCDSSSNNNSNDSGEGSCHRRHHKNKGGFAAQAIVGMGYNYCDSFDLTLEYRYLYVSGSKNSNANNNAIVVGAYTGF